ncbi:hypothetical protein [Hymenobacter sp. BRD67]|uniref:hypothetical protein n=1 Tax=Hymenobacter sp. BRD67 TaxID=2675877 RepID=UPI001C274FC5|nr:hypothetical protein [Hymenobacter sp. BRD67]
MQRIRQVDFAANERLNYFREFYRVRRRQQKARGGRVLGQVFFQRKKGHRAVRVEQIVVLGFHPPNGGAGVGIAHRVAAQQLAQGGVLMLKQLENPDKIAGVANVHRVRDSRDGGSGCKYRSAQIFGPGVVGIAGRDKMAHRKPRGVGQQAGAKVAEVTAGHCYHRGAAGCHCCRAKR